VHDIADLEGRGTPGVFVATVEFATGVSAQASALGIDPAHVLVAHPIQDRTDDEMREIAEIAFPAIVTALTR
jgi:hypothetical protein